MSIRDRRVRRRFSLASVAVVLLLCLSFVSSVAESSPVTQQGSVPCLSSSDTLEDLVYCFYDYVPDRYSKDGRDGFDVPTPEELMQWREVVERMMDGECETIDLSAYDWGGDFTVTTFADVEVGSSYCILMETRYETYPDPAGPRLAHGWGTFIYNPVPLRELSIGAPHVKYEAWTDREAAGIFKRTQSRTLLMNGAHRYASDVDSGCQASPTANGPTLRTTRSTCSTPPWRS